MPQSLPWQQCGGVGVVGWGVEVKDGERPVQMFWYGLSLCYWEYPSIAGAHIAGGEAPKTWRISIGEQAHRHTPAKEPAHQHMLG